MPDWMPCVPFNTFSGGGRRAATSPAALTVAITGRYCRPAVGTSTTGGRWMTTGDACPGILDRHEARDALVARIRLPGGYASPARLRALAVLAQRFGDGHVDLTARGNVQI